MIPATGRDRDHGHGVESSHRARTFLLDRPLIAEAISGRATGLTDQPDLSQLRSGQRHHRLVDRRIYSRQLWLTHAAA